VKPRRWKRPFDIRKACLLVADSFVRYYDEGWRHGYVESLSSSTVRVKPWKTCNATVQPRSVTVTLGDIEI